MYNRATKYLESGRADKAVQFFKKQIAERPFKEAYLNLGNSYRLLDMNKEALVAYMRANSPDVPFLDGKYTEYYDLALSNLGLHSYMLGRDDEAIEFYQACLKINPLHYDCIWNYSNALLRKWCNGEGDCEDSVNGAWRMYSYRFKRSSPVTLDTSVPLWDGISRVEKLCVLAEQGMGDKIMFGRYIHRLREYTNNIVVQIPSELNCFFTDYEVVNGLASSSAATAGVPICSLASKFESSSLVETTWDNAEVTVRRKLAESAEWLPKFAKREFDGKNLKIGVVWSGSPTHANDRNRSIPAGYFSRLSGFGDVYYLGLDKKCPSSIKHIGSSDWASTSASLLGLDLLISCDTSIVHVAGSLGVKTWMLQPLVETDFRWGHGGESCWYPSVDVMQNPGSWEKMFDIVCARLTEVKRQYDHEKMFGFLIPPVAEKLGISEDLVRVELGLEKAL